MKDKFKLKLKRFLRKFLVKEKQNHNEAAYLSEKWRNFHALDAKSIYVKAERGEESTHNLLKHMLESKHKSILWSKNTGLDIHHIKHILEDKFKVKVKKISYNILLIQYKKKEKTVRFSDINDQARGLKVDSIYIDQIRPSIIEEDKQSDFEKVLSKLETYTKQLVIADNNESKLFDLLNYKVEKENENDMFIKVKKAQARIESYLIRNMDVILFI